MTLSLPIKYKRPQKPAKPFTLYIARHLTDDGSSAGRSFHASEAAAVRQWRKQRDDAGRSDFIPDVEPISVIPTKVGILAALNRHGGHADNG